VTRGPDKTEAAVTPSAQLKTEGVSVKGSKDGLTASAEGPTGKFKGVINDEGSIAAEITVSDEGQETGGGFALDNKEGFKASVTHDSITGTAGFNGDSMSYGIGKEFAFDVGAGEVEAEVSAEVALQGVTKEDRDAFVSDSEVGFFDAPPELARGKGWDSLSAETRGHYENLGWTQKEWATAADLARATRR